MGLGIIMEMDGMVGVVMVAEVEAAEEVVLLGDEEEVMVSRVDTMTMLKVHLPKVVVSSWSSDFYALLFCAFYFLYCNCTLFFGLTASALSSLACSSKWRSFIFLVEINGNRW